MDGTLVVKQRQAPQETVEVPQAQYTDRIIDVLVTAQCRAPKIVSQDRIPQRIVEQITDTPVPQVTEELVEAFSEQFVDIPVPQVAEKVIEVFNVFSQSRFSQSRFNSESWSRLLRLQQFLLMRRSWRHPKPRRRRRSFCCLKEDQSDFSEERRLNVPVETERQERRLNCAVEGADSVCHELPRVSTTQELRE